MSDMISLPVNDIPEPDRRSLENLLGHPLTADQQVFVMVYSAGTIADEQTRRAAAERIRHTLNEVDRRRAAQGITDEEVDADVDESMEYIRPPYKLKDLVAKIPKGYRPEEVDWGLPKGEEA
jgi:hypothetical protein